MAERSVRAVTYDKQTIVIHWYKNVDVLFPDLGSVTTNINLSFSIIEHHAAPRHTNQEESLISKWINVISGDKRSLKKLNLVTRISAFVSAVTKGMSQVTDSIVHYTYSFRQPFGYDVQNINVYPNLINHSQLCPIKNVTKVFYGEQCHCSCS